MADEDDTIESRMAWIDRVGKEIAVGGGQGHPYFNMGLTASVDEKEYENSVSIIDPIASPATFPITIPKPDPMPITALITGAAILAKAQSYLGKLHDGPDVPTMARATAAAFPDDQELAKYCTEATNDMPWCGDFIAFVLKDFGIKPPPVKNGVGFFYVDRWLDFGAPIPVEQRQLGDLAIYLGDPHHITFVGRDGKYVGGNQSDGVTMASYRTPDAIRRAPGVEATTVAVSEHPELQNGSTDRGAVTLLQQRLLAWGFDVGPDGADGDFGGNTEAAVKAFQGARGVEVDGVVGADTWAALLATPGAPQGQGDTVTLPGPVISQVADLAGKSSLASYSWADRGRAPSGYTKGVAVAFAAALLKLKANDPVTLAMTAPIGGSADALAYYGLSGADRPMILRRLFVFLYGLGMRESSGRYCCGRDTSASNVSADTAEAGLFQQSWNSRDASPQLPKLFALYQKTDWDGLRAIFAEGVTPTSADLDNFGSGDGEAFQALAKSKPMFAVEAAAVGVRVLRSHWGPIMRREVEIVPEADALLQQVQAIVDAVPSPAPVPIPTPVTPPIEPTPIPAPVDTLTQILQRIAALEKRMADLADAPPPVAPVLAAAPGTAALEKRLADLQARITQFDAFAHTVTDALDRITKVMGQLAGGVPVPAVLPQPLPVPGVPPVSPAPPTGAHSTDVRTGLLGLVGTLLGIGTGAMGMPAGLVDGGTLTGLLVPALTVGASALGIPSAVVPIITRVFSGLMQLGKTRPQA